jgi:hypothetical protein
LIRFFGVFFPSGLCSRGGLLRKSRTIFWNSGFFVGSDLAMANIFKSPKSMLGRAKRHLADVESQINAFLKGKPWHISGP